MASGNVVMVGLIARLVSALITAVPRDLARSAVDSMLDRIEYAVAESGNQIDDVVVLPLCKLIRDSFDIPDKD